jgi:hypothetical protein
MQAVRCTTVILPWVVREPARWNRCDSVPLQVLQADVLVHQLSLLFTGLLQVLFVSFLILLDPSPKMVARVVYSVW